MPGLNWGPEQAQRLAAIKDELAKVSTATAFTMLNQQGWRNTYAKGLLPLEQLGLGKRLVGRARTVRYLLRRGPERLPTTPDEQAAAREARKRSPEIVLIESLEPGDFFCVEALGVKTAGIIGDILATRIKYQGALGAIVHGAVRDTPYLKQVGLPVFTGAAHPSASGRDVIPVDYDIPINLSGVHVVPGDIVLADDEGALVMPLELAEHVAAGGPAKEHLEIWIREKVERGGSVLDYYPPLPEKEAEYERETGHKVKH